VIHEVLNRIIEGVQLAPTGNREIDLLAILTALNHTKMSPATHASADGLVRRSENERRLLNAGVGDGSSTNRRSIVFEEIVTPRAESPTTQGNPGSIVYY